MTKIDLGSEDAADGLIALVVAVIELLVETMEREGVRRMESGQLSSEEIERLGSQFMSIEEEIARIKDDADVEQDVDEFRNQLHELVDDAVDSIDAAQAESTGHRTESTSAQPESGGPRSES